ncbi:MAG TPA: hypothetical protein VFE06_08000 [Acidobacteriaceae bacterium]|jgi:hypothetical protein|nr:hypothetical protein [Acidobacteriaceae bacterium]
MTLMDAPAFNAPQARRNHVLSVTAIVVVIVIAIGTWLWFLQIPWQFWHWPADHKVNNFFAAVESGDLQKAYGLWNNDPSWQQHPQQFGPYNFTEFQKDWGSASDYGVIKSHNIIVSRRVGNGVVIGLDINGGKTPIFLRVDSKTKTIGFSPVELYSGP